MIMRFCSCMEYTCDESHSTSPLKIIGFVCFGIGNGWYYLYRTKFTSELLASSWTAAECELQETLLCDHTPSYLRKLWCNILCIYLESHICLRVSQNFSLLCSHILITEYKIHYFLEAKDEPTVAPALASVSFSEDARK